MNRIYRTLWSVATQSWRAVPETAKTAGKKSKSSAGGAIASFALSWVLTGGANAQAPPAINQLPTGGSVARGTATITQTATAQAAAMTVNQTSQRAVVNWNTFNIGSAASVNFVQPNAQAVTLNRVNDSNPSQIFGRMTSNGQVVLTNANGIYFAPGSSVDVGAITATTHSISNDNFMSGKYVFERNGATGKIVNEGRITAALAGYVALLAPEVQNAGVVVARAGTVAMAAGETITLNIDGAGSLAGITTTPSAIATLIENKQAVQAPDGQIILSAVALNKLQAGVIKNSGSLEANSLVSKGGKIYLEGDDITLTSTSKLEAKGATGGGTVLVGGDWQGSGNLRQATKVTMEAGATIDASATDKGDGGKVVLWSDVHNADSQTSIAGVIVAEGRGDQTKGGQIETSGAKLDIADSATIRMGGTGASGGRWLLDPVDFTIAATGGNITGTALGNSITAGNTVEILNTSGTTGTAGNINVNANVSWNNSGILKLTASGGVAGSNNIGMGTGGGGLIFNQEGTSEYGGIISGNGTFTKDGAGTIKLSNTNTYTGTTTITNGTLQLGATSNGTLGTGDVINNGTLAFNLSSAYTLSNTISGVGSLKQVSTSGNGYVVLTGTNTYSGGTTTSSAAGFRVGLDTGLGTSGSLGTGPVENKAGGGLVFQRNDDYTIVNDISGNGIIRKTGNGTLTLSGNSNYTGTIAGFSDTRIEKGTIKVGSSTAFGSADITITSGAALDLNGQIMTSGGKLTLNGSGVNNTGGALFNSSTLGATYPGMVVLGSSASTITGGTGTIALSNIGSISGSYGLTLDGASGGSIASVIGTSTLTKAGAGTWTLSGVNTYTGATTISAGTLDISNSGSLGGGNYSGAIANSGTLKYSSSAAQTFGGIISGTGSLVKDTSAASTLTLTKANTYTGDTTINAGTLVIGGTGSLGSSGTYAGNITNNSTFQYSSSSAQTLSGLMSGAGQVTKDTGTGSLTMSGANTFSGNITLSAGNLDLKLSPAGGTDSRNFSNTGTGTLTARGDFIQNGVMSGSGNYALRPSTSAGITLNGANTFAGNLSIYGKVFLGSDNVPVAGVLSAGPLGLGSVSLETNGVLDLNGHDVTLATNKSLTTSSSSIAGLKLINSTGTAYWRSPLTIQSSNLVIDVADGATLEISNVQNGGSTINSTSELAFSKTGAGTLRYITPADGTSKQYFSNVTLSAGVMDVNSSTAQGPLMQGRSFTVASGAELKIGKYNANSLWMSYAASNRPNLVNSGTVTIYSDSTSTYSSPLFSGGGVGGGITGSGNVVFTGNGLIKVGDNYSTPTGTNTILAGTTVEVTSGKSLFHGSTTATINVLGALKLNGPSSGAFDFTNGLSGSGTLEIATNTLGLAKNNSGFTGTTTIDLGANLNLGSINTPSSVPGFLSGPINNSGTLTLNSTTTYSLLNDISGSGALSKTGGGNASLSGSLTYTGLTTISGGTLSLTGVNVFAGAGGVTGSGTLIYKSPITSTITGTITSALTVDAGIGSLILTNNSNSITTPTITSGTLRIGNGGTTGILGTSANATVNGSLVIDRSDAYSLSSILASVGSGTGNVSISSGDNLTINKALSLSGTNSLIDIFSIGNLTLGAVTLANTGTSGGIKFRANGGVTFSSASSVLNASGTSGSITVSAGSNLLAGDTTAGYDITMTSAGSSAISTSATGTVNIFQGNANTTALSSKIASTAAGGASTKKYKTYGSTYASLSTSVGGTRNFYYRSNPSGVTVSGVTASKTYDGTTNAIGFITGGTVAGLSADETGLTGLGLVFATADFVDANAGTGKNLTLGGVSLSNAAWSISGLSATLGGGSSGTINKANLTLSGSKVYDGTTVVAGSKLLATGVHSESFSVTGSGAVGNLTSADVQATSTALASVTGLAVGISNGINTGDASNYNLLSTTGSTFSVSRATASLTGLKVYDANNTLTGTQLGITGVTVGGTTQTLNYTGSASLFDANVATPNNYVTSSNLVLTNNGSFLANNYVLPAFTRNANNSATVSAATATVTASKTYDSDTTLSTGHVTITGLSVGGTAQTLSFTGIAALSDANVATVNKHVNTSGMTLADGSTGIASNYVLPASAYNVTRNTATISRFALTATDVNTGTSVYGDPMAPGSVTFANKFGTDDVNAVVTVTVPAGSLSGSGMAKVGNYFQSASTSLTGSKAGNYSFNGVTSQAANYTINPLTLTGATISAATSDYGSPLTAGNVTFTNALAGDQVTTSASVNTNTLSGAQLPVVGTYTQTTGTALTGADASNYTLPTGITGAANYTINAKALTISVPGATRMYDSSTSIYPTAPASVLGVIGSDQVVISAGNVTGFVDKNIGTNKAVTYTGFAFTGADASNYVLSANPASTAEITAKPITVVGITANDKVYNGTTSASLNIGAAALTSGANSNTDNKVYSADSVAVDASAAVGTFANANVGTAKPATITGLALSGTDAGNYIVTDASNATASITPKALTVSGTSVANKTYDGTTTASLSNGTLVGVINTDLAHVSLIESGDFSDKNAGLAKPVTANDVLSGTAASNYSLTQPTGLTANIYKAGLTVSAVDAEKIYGSDNPALTVALSGFVGGETLATSGVSGSGLATTSATINTNPGTTVINAAVGTLTADNYEFTRFVNGALTIKSIGGLNNTEIITLISGSQLAALSSTQLNGFSASQLQVFSAQQLSSLSASQLMGLTATQISSLSNVQLLALSPVQVSALKPEQLSALTSAQISLLTGNNSVTFSVEQMLSLSPSQIAAISPTMVAGMTTAELGALSDAQLQALTPTQLAAIAPANFATFTPAQIMALSITQVQNLSPEQLATFSPAQIASITAAELAYFDVRQLAAIGIFPKVETPVSVADASTVKTEEKGNSTTFEAPIPVMTEVAAANVPLAVAATSALTPSETATTSTVPEQTAALSPRALQNLLFAPNTETSPRTGVLAITILNSAQTTPTTAGIAFEQDADTVSLRFTSAPASAPPMSDKVVFRDKLVTFMVATSSGVMVEFEGSVVNNRMVIVAPSPIAKRIARTEINLVLAAAVTSLGKENRVMLASLTGVVLDLR